MRNQFKILVFVSLMSLLSFEGLSQYSENTKNVKLCLEHEVGGKFFLGTGGLLSLEVGGFLSIGGGVGFTVEPGFFGSNNTYLLAVPIFATITTNSESKYSPLLDFSTTLIDEDKKYYSFGAGFRRHFQNKYFKTQIQMLYIDETSSSFMTVWLGLGLGVKI